jgi:hypothetical protein
MPLTSLPTEIVLKVVSFIEHPEALMHVNNRFRRIVRKSMVDNALKEWGPAHALDRLLYVGIRDKQVFIELLSRGAKVSDRALICAIEERKLGLVIFLVEAGAAVNPAPFSNSEFIYPFGSSPLGKAIGDRRILAYLIDKGARLPSQCAFRYMLQAVHQGNNDDIRLLQNAGVFDHMNGEQYFMNYLSRCTVD